MARIDKSGISSLKIFIFSNTDEVLKSLLAEKEDVIGLCCKKPCRTGFKEMVKQILIACGIFWKDDFSYRKNPFKKFESPIKIARRKGMPVLYSDRLGTAEFETTLRNLEPDLILVAGFHRLIPANIIKIPKKAIINLHPSLLPRHRGGTPSRWVIRNGESESGVTAHFVNERFDEGDIILQEKVSVRLGETWGELEERISEALVRMTHTIIRMAKEGEIKGVPQNADLATYEPSYNGEHKKINWLLRPVEIKRLCYAIRPKSGGMTTYNNRKVCIWDIEILDKVNNSSLPGTIIDIDSDGCPVVACSEGCVKLLSFVYRGNIVCAEKIVDKYKMRKGYQFV